jgi:hypothetical protein
LGGAQADRKRADKSVPLRTLAMSCGCNHACTIHGHDHAVAWSKRLPVSELKSFWSVTWLRVLGGVITDREVRTLRIGANRSSRARSVGHRHRARWNRLAGGQWNFRPVIRAQSKWLLASRHTASVRAAYSRGSRFVPWPIATDGVLPSPVTFGTLRTWTNFSPCDNLQRTTH